MKTNLEVWNSLTDIEQLALQIAVAGGRLWQLGLVDEYYQATAYGEGVERCGRERLDQYRELVRLANEAGKVTKP